MTVNDISPIMDSIQIWGNLPHQSLSNIWEVVPTFGNGLEHRWPLSFDVLLTTIVLITILLTICPEISLDKYDSWFGQSCNLDSGLLSHLSWYSTSSCYQLTTDVFVDPFIYRLLLPFFTLTILRYCWPLPDDRSNISTTSNNQKKNSCRVVLILTAI